MPRGKPPSGELSDSSPRPPHEAGASSAARRDPYHTALRKLARRPYAVAELRRALERNFPADPAVGEALARLRELGYLNDKKVAELIASSLARNRNFGPHRIRRELKARLVDYRFIEAAIAQAFEETNVHALLERALDRKLRTMRLPLTQRKFASLCRGLLRQGFAAGDIMKSVRARPELRPVAGDVDLSALETEKGAEGEA